MVSPSSLASLSFDGHFRKQQQRKTPHEYQEMDGIGLEIPMLVHLGNQIRGTDVEKIAGRKRYQPAHIHLKR